MVFNTNCCFFPGHLQVPRQHKCTDAALTPMSNDRIGPDDKPCTSTGIHSQFQSICVPMEGSQKIPFPQPLMESSSATSPDNCTVVEPERSQTVPRVGFPKFGSVFRSVLKKESMDDFCQKRDSCDIEKICAPSYASPKSRQFSTVAMLKDDNVST